MKNVYTVLFIILILKTRIYFAQTCTAVPVITLNPAGVNGVVTHMMVAYNPVNNLYYWNSGGFGSNPIATYSSTGGNTVAAAVGNQDWRGLWWNSNTNSLEGNCYNSLGIFKVTLNQNGYVAGGSTIIAPNQQPAPQLGGQYDPTANQILYYNGAMAIAKYNRNTGLLVNTVNITGLPGGIGSIASYGFYTGIPGMEYAIFDYTYKRAYYINYITGSYVSTVQFPVSAGSPGAFSLSYANGLFFIYDNTNWIGYRAGIWAGHNSPICLGGTATINAQGATNYTWSTGANTNSITVSPPVTTIYSVSASPTLGCVSDFTVSVNINLALNPTVSITGNTLICGSGTATLMASGANTYTWSNGSITPSTITSPSTTTNFTVVGTNTAGCTNTQTISVMVSPNPTLAVTGNTTICSGQSTTLSASGASTYSWSNGVISPSVVLSPVSTTGYSIVGTSNTGCSSTHAVTISVNPSPTLSFSGGANVCNGQTLALFVNGADTYTWGNGSTSNSIAISPTVNTTFSATGTNTLNGCQTTALHNMTVNPIPTISVSGNIIICPGQTATLMASGANTYTWGTGSTTSSIVVSPTINTTYPIEGISADGCKGTYTVDIIVTICTGMQNIAGANRNVSVYPNPANSAITVSLNDPKESDEILIYNALGELIIRQEVKSVDTTIDIQTLANGIYIIHLASEHKVVPVSKIVKQ